MLLLKSVTDNFTICIHQGSVLLASASLDFYSHFACTNKQNVCTWLILSACHTLLYFIKIIWGSRLYKLHPERIYFSFGNIMRMRWFETDFSLSKIFLSSSLLFHYCSCWRVHSKFCVSPWPQVTLNSKLLLLCP